MEMRYTDIGMKLLQAIGLEARMKNVISVTTALKTHYDGK